MFSENNKVSGRQIKKMLVFDMMSISILVIPDISVMGAGRDGLFAIIIAALAALIYGCFFLYVSKKINGDYIGFCIQQTGRVTTWVIGLLYLIKMLISCWFTLSLFCSVIRGTLLPDTNEKLILLTFIILGIYMSIKGIEVRARVTEILFYVVLIPLVLILLLGLKNIDVTNLFPVFTSGKLDIIKTSYMVLLAYSSIEFLLFALPYVTNKDNQENEHKKGVVTAIILSSLVNIILFVLVLGMLGIADASVQFNSSITILQVIEIPIGFVRRQDAIILLFWMLSMFTIISAYFYYLSHITMRLVNKKGRLRYFIFYGIVIFLISMMYLTPDQTIAYYMKYMAYIGMPQSIVIPVIVFAIARIKAVRKGKSPQIGAEHEK